MPILITVAAAVSASLGRPILFRQARTGLGGRVFQILKFRTMILGGVRESSPDADAARMTPIGGLVRALSLDELPQLWNVLKGEMSLVGPRPLLPEYLPRYSAFQRRRHEVQPGITGWAQVNGRNALSWEKKFELDVWYVDHATLWLDTKILWLTLLKVIRRDGVSQVGHATMPEFMGNTQVAQQHE